MKCSEAAGRSSQGRRKASCPGLCVSPQGSFQKNGNSRVTWADGGHLGTGALWACLWASGMPPMSCPGASLGRPVLPEWCASPLVEGRVGWRPGHVTGQLLPLPQSSSPRRSPRRPLRSLSALRVPNALTQSHAPQNPVCFE